MQSSPQLKLCTWKLFTTIIKRHGRIKLQPETEATKSLQYGKKRKIPNDQWMATVWGYKGTCTKIEECKRIKTRRIQLGDVKVI